MSPVFTSAILLFLSGIPLLEEKVNTSCCECLMINFSNKRISKRLEALFLKIEPTLRRTTSSATILPMWSSSSAPHDSSYSPLPFTKPSLICYRWLPRNLVFVSYFKSAQCLCCCEFPIYNKLAEERGELTRDNVEEGQVDQFNQFGWKIDGDFFLKVVVNQPWVEERCVQF